MQQEFDGVTFLVGDDDVLLNMEITPVLPIFSDKVREFLSILSNELLHNNNAKQFGDVIAYAFWIRKTAIDKECEKYDSGISRVGRGIAFQIAPSNIPIQFAVSMTYALISGNISVVRVSKRKYVQIDIICDTINKVIEEKCKWMRQYICIIRYEHDNLLTQWLSNKCDIRVIWGGNDTIEQIRKIPIRPRTIELGFADRYSIAIINSDEYLNSDYKVFARDFYNDTYYTDQNACSSSRLLVWVGNNIYKAQEIFWESLVKEVNDRYSLSEIAGSEKLLNTVVCASQHPNIKEIRYNNAVVRVKLMQLYEDIMDYKGNCGYFFEYEANDLKDIVPLLKKECQTVTFFGKTLEEDIHTIVEDYGVRGVDRIVPIGHSMDLSFIWDGFDLPITLSRIVGNI